MNRLKETYKKEIAPALFEELSLENPKHLMKLFGI